MRHWKSWRHGLCAALMGFLALAGSPTIAGSLFGPSPQDDCAIGTVTRERYRAIVAEVATLPPIPWDRVVAAATSGPNPVLTEYFRAVLAPVADPDAQVATMHAILRREGAGYSWSNLAYDHSKFPTHSETRAWDLVVYNYAIDRSILGNYLPFCRGSAVVVNLKKASASSTSGTLFVRDSAVIIPDCLKYFSHADPIASTCPTAPADVSPMRPKESAESAP